MQIVWTKLEPGGMELSELSPGDLFRARSGSTPYMVICISAPMKAIEMKGVDCILALSLESGQLHEFERSYPIIPLEGRLELARIRCERRK